MVQPVLNKPKSTSGSCSVSSILKSALLLILGIIIGRGSNGGFSSTTDGQQSLLPIVSCPTTTASGKESVSSTKDQDSEVLSSNNKKDDTKKQRSIDDGWTDIGVFYGKKDLLERDFVPPNRPWFSQTLQDQMVVGLLGHNRREEDDGFFFVDMAANHAWQLSNTLALERNLNWTGLCIEANPKYWRDLTQRKCQVVAAAVGGTRLEELTFVLDDTLGGILGNDTDNTPQLSAEKTKMTVYTVPLLEILDRYRAPAVIDYLSLDVEGAEEFIMKDFPFDKYRFEVMTVERPSPKLKQLLAKQGYVQLRDEIFYGETIWGYEKSTKDGTLNIQFMEQYPKGPLPFNKLKKLRGD